MTSICISIEFGKPDDSTIRQTVIVYHNTIHYTHPYVIIKDSGTCCTTLTIYIELKMQYNGLKQTL